MDDFGLVSLALALFDSELVYAGAHHLLVLRLRQPIPRPLRLETILAVTLFVD